MAGRYEEIAPMKPNSESAVAFLRSIEWSMGCGGDKNQGQCDYCGGCSNDWGNHLPDWGHKTDCPLALALKNEGEKVDFLQPKIGYVPMPSIFTDDDIKEMKARHEAIIDKAIIAASGMRD